VVEQPPPHLLLLQPLLNPLRMVTLLLWLPMFRQCWMQPSAAVVEGLLRRLRHQQQLLPPLHPQQQHLRSVA
jgi:hypothetical protein